MTPELAKNYLIFEGEFLKWWIISWWIVTGAFACCMCCCIYCCLKGRRSTMFSASLRE